MVKKGKKPIPGKKYRTSCRQHSRPTTWAVGICGRLFVYICDIYICLSGISKTSHL